MYDFRQKECTTNLVGGMLVTTEEGATQAISSDSTLADSGAVQAHSPKLSRTVSSLHFSAHKILQNKEHFSFWRKAPKAEMEPHAITAETEKVVSVCCFFEVQITRAAWKASALTPGVQSCKFWLDGACQGTQCQ